MKGALALLLISLGIGVLPAKAAETDGWQPVVLPQTEQRDIHSRHTGNDYRLFVSQPQQPPPPGGYPVLYVLDGNALFPLLALQANALENRPDPALRTSVLVVGVGYPGDALYDVKKRARDYTPPPVKAGAAEEPDPRYGGAEAFLAFLQSELKPLIEARYQVDRQQQTLFGHSHGGLFALYTLINQPGAFQNYLAASPSLWWNDGQILRQSDRLLANASSLAPTRLWLTVGGAEEPPAGTTPASARERHQAERRMRSNLQALHEHLAPLDGHGLSRKLSINPDAGHGDNGTLTAARAVAFAAQPKAAD